MKEQAVSLFPEKVDVKNHHSLAFEILQMKSVIYNIIMHGCVQLLNDFFLNLLVQE